VRFLADSNIVAQAVRALRAAGHDVLYLGERTTDRGDQAFLAETVTEGRIILTKLPHPPLPRERGRVREGVYSCIVICNCIAAYCFSRLGDAAAESDLILATLSSHGDRLAARAFLRAGPAGIRESRG
jgi:hypothetical protein